MQRSELMYAREWKTGKESMTVNYKEAAKASEEMLTHTDWWMGGNGIENFGPMAVCLPLSIRFGWHCVTGSWQRSWVTPPLEIMMEVTGTYTITRKYTDTEGNQPQFSTCRILLHISLQTWEFIVSFCKCWAFFLNYDQRQLQVESSWVHESKHNSENNFFQYCLLGWNSATAWV